MRARIAEHDVPHLPAYVRLDIIYLRMRMQFWQGRIGSSTNRFRSSFSPWTNRRVLEAMLTTHWKERDHQMLSRLFLRALHPDLSRVGVARGEPAGPSFWDVVRGMPREASILCGASFGASRLGPNGRGRSRHVPASRSTVGGDRGTRASSRCGLRPDRDGWPGDPAASARTIGDAGPRQGQPERAFLLTSNCWIARRRNEISSTQLSENDIGAEFLTELARIGVRQF